eukprot:GHVS01031270.1.p1 GENE.GHVS01031270.1~~GHVS01031270.1.p1  ORF type:complete len:329 (-),score=70.31 GHVS01031270.1:1050-2003(-)
MPPHNLEILPTSSPSNTSLHSPSSCCSCSCLGSYQADRAKVMLLFKDEKISDAFELTEAMLSKWPRWFTDFDEGISEVLFRFMEVIRILRGMNSDHPLPTVAAPGMEGGEEKEGGNHMKEMGESNRGAVCEETVAGNSLMKNFLQKRQQIAVEQMKIYSCGHSVCSAVVGDKCDGHRSRGCSLLEHFLSLPLFSYTFHNSDSCIFFHPSHANNHHHRCSTDEDHLPSGGLMRVALQEGSCCGGLCGVGEWLGLKVLGGSLLDKVVHESTRPPEQLNAQSPVVWRLLVGKEDEQEEKEEKTSDVKIKETSPRMSVVEG